MDISSLRREISYYFVDNSQPALLTYSLPLALALKSEEITPTPNVTLEKCFEQLFKGKRVGDIGCRTGLFLKFARSFGAEVYGTTGRGLEEAKKEHGAKHIFNAEASDAARHLRPLNLDLLFSVNLFNTGRLQKPSEPPFDAPKLLNKILDAASPQTKFFLAPATEPTGSSLREAHVTSNPRIHELKHYHAIIDNQPNLKPLQGKLYSFRVR